jgi:hypothetical protein
MTTEDMKFVRKALDEAHNALGALRRMHGNEVQSLCYPAYNSIGDALRIMTLEGYEYSESEPVE